MSKEFKTPDTTPGGVPDIDVPQVTQKFTSRGDKVLANRALEAAGAADPDMQAEIASRWDEIFKAKAKEVGEFIAHHKWWPVVSSPLGHWLAQQRTNKRQGKLSAARAEMLENVVREACEPLLPYLWEVFEAIFIDRCEDLGDYVERYGDVPPRGTELGHFLDNMRSTMAGYGTMNASPARFAMVELAVRAKRPDVADKMWGDRRAGQVDKSIQNLADVLRAKPGVWPSRSSGPESKRANDFLLNYCAATKGRGHHKASKERTDQIRAVFQDSAPGLLARFERSLGHIGT